MPLNKRGILLQVLAGYGEKGISPPNLQADVGLDSSEFNVALNEALADGEIVELPNGNVSLSDKLKDTIAPLRPITTVMGEHSSVKVDIRDSAIGLLNLGEFENVKSIRINVSTLKNSGNREIAEALDELTKSVTESRELSAAQRTELIQALKELSRQAALPAEERTDPGVISSILIGFSIAIQSAGGLAQVWQVWGEPIRKFFGL